jgi:ammonium transporter, Amt family
MTMNGCLCALAAITAGCATVDTWAAVVIGVVAGWVYMFASKLMVLLRIDDAVDAIPVHMFGGAWGLIAVGLFTKPELLMRAYAKDTVPYVGWFYEWNRGSGDFTLIGNQLIAVIWVFGWTFTILGAYFFFLNFMGWLRVSALEEEAGMDISRHKGSCYDISPANEEAVKELSMSRHGGNNYVISAEKKETIAAAAVEEGEVDA